MVLLALTGCMKEEQTTTYSWPQAAGLPEAVEYSGNGEIVYVEKKDTYADGLGGVEGVNHWIVYVDQATAGSVYGYRSYLREAGFTWYDYGSGEAEEDDIARALAEQGRYSWQGVTEENTVLITFTEQTADAQFPLSTEDDASGKTFDASYNLMIEVVDANVWEKMAQEGGLADISAEEET